jgi:hypothetical protein
MSARREYHRCAAAKPRHIRKLGQIEREEKPGGPRYRFANPATLDKLRQAPPDNADIMDVVSCNTTALCLPPVRSRAT